MSKIPWTTVAVFAVTVAALLVMVITGHTGNDFFPVLVTLCPGLLGTTFFAEKTAKQTSNGHMKQAVKQAINEVATEAPPEVPNGPVHG